MYAVWAHCLPAHAFGAFVSVGIVNVFMIFAMTAR